MPIERLFPQIVENLIGRKLVAQAARADLCRRAGRIEEARAAYRAALALCQQGAQRAFLEKHLAALDVEPRAP